MNVYGKEIIFSAVILFVLVVLPLFLMLHVNQNNYEISQLKVGVNYLYLHNTDLIDKNNYSNPNNNIFLLGSYSKTNGIIINETKDITNKAMCETFFHELGHRIARSQISPDFTEEAAENYETQNVWRCEGI